MGPSSGPILSRRGPGTALLFLVLAPWFASGGCATTGAGARQIVETRDLPQAGGSPSIIQVQDLGGIDVPANGELRPRNLPDGIAVIGETLWITGKSFGRQPTVTVGGRPAAVLSRTGDGGILVRVPVGAAAGPGVVTVEQEHGSAQAPLDIRRYAAVLSNGRITWLDVAGGAPVVTTRYDVASGRFLRMSPDGRAAYVAGGPQLAVFEIAETGPPGARSQSPQLGGAGTVVSLSVAAAAQRLVVVREADLLLFDISRPARPSLSQTRPLPPAARAGRVVRAELSPGGRHLALALAEGNRVLLVDLSQAKDGDAAIVADLPLATDTRAPVLANLAFAHDGRTLWVLAGETPESRPLGPQATRVFALRVKPDALAGGLLELARSVTVAAAVEPLRLSTGRSLPLASGAAVRLPPEKATVYLTAAVRESRRSAVFSIGAQDAAAELGATDGGVRISGLDVTPEGRWLLAAAVDGGQVRLLSAPADGRPGAVRTLTLGGGTGSAAAEVRIQP